MGKNIKDAIIFIWISSATFLIIQFNSYYSFFTNGITNGISIPNRIINFMVITAIVVISIPTIDLIFDILKIGQYRNGKRNLINKASKVIFIYILLIAIFTGATFLLELSCDFKDKTNEFTHYTNEYKIKMKNTSYQVIPYTNQFYFKDTYFRFWANGTMYNSNNFTEEFIKLENQPLDKSNLYNVLKLDTSNLSNKLIEDIYYEVQTISTLGYGNITPQYPIGMVMTILTVLSGQFITIVGVVLVIRE